jgi:hypothetical protein
MSYAMLPTLNLDKNKNYIINEEKNLRIITDRINNQSPERINEVNNDINTRNKKYIKNSIINELLLRNKKRKKNEQSTINYNNSFLNITVNQIRECPLFEKIKIPKDGHSRGIIEILKNFKQSKERKSKGSKSGERDKNNENDHEKNNQNRKNVSKKKIKCLYDQKMFDEPKNKHIMNRNFSYQKKILKNKKVQNNKNKGLKKAETNNKFINNELKKIQTLNKSIKFKPISYKPKNSDNNLEKKEEKNLNNFDLFFLENKNNSINNIFSNNNLETLNNKKKKNNKKLILNKKKTQIKNKKNS